MLSSFHHSVVIVHVLLSHYRSAQRIVHIPFFAPSKPVSPSEHAKHEALLKEARSDASAAVGEIIRMGDHLVSASVQDHMKSQILPFVIQHTPSLHYRVQKCYALAQTAAELVSYSLQ